MAQRKQPERSNHGRDTAKAAVGYTRTMSIFVYEFPGWQRASYAVKRILRSRGFRKTCRVLASTHVNRAEEYKFPPVVLYNLSARSSTHFFPCRSPLLVIFRHALFSALPSPGGSDQNIILA